MRTSARTTCTRPSLSSPTPTCHPQTGCQSIPAGETTPTTEIVAYPPHPTSPHLLVQTCRGDEEDNVCCGGRWQGTGGAYVSWLPGGLAGLCACVPVCMCGCGCSLSGVTPPCVSLNEDCSYLMVFLKFVQAVIPTVEYDYTKQLSLAT